MPSRLESIKPRGLRALRAWILNMKMDIYPQHFAKYFVALRIMVEYWWIEYSIQWQ